MYKDTIMPGYLEQTLVDERTKRILSNLAHAQKIRDQGHKLLKKYTTY